MLTGWAAHERRGCRCPPGDRNECHAGARDRDRVHAVELTVGIAFGAAGVLFLVGNRSPQSRRVATAPAGLAALGAALLAGALIAT